MIVNNTKEAAQFLPSLNLTLDNHRFTDFFRRAQEWLTSRIIGDDLATLLDHEEEPEEPDDPEEPEITSEEIEEITEPVGESEEDPEQPTEDENHDLLILCQRVIAEKALLDAIPEMDMQLTEAGFAVQDNDNFSPASAQRVDRLLKTLPDRLADDVDSLVQYLLKNSDANDKPYKSWRETEQFEYLTAAFLPLRSHYNRYVNERAATYDAFYDSITMMAEELKTVAAYFVSDAEINRLLGLYRSALLSRIQSKAVFTLGMTAAFAHAKALGQARNEAIVTRDIMLSDPDSFPDFKASSAFARKDFSLDGGRVGNML